VFSDYGHHPTAIRETLKAIKIFYPNQRIVLAFQPHEHTRVKVLLKDFIKCFDDTDVLILEEIYTVPGRESEKEIKMISSQDVIKGIQKHNHTLKPIYAKDNSEVLKSLNRVIKKNDVVLIMGAGKIYDVLHDIDFKK
jgi:UDP-N-acetylmuramate--alanine ligase